MNEASELDLDIPFGHLAALQWGNPGARPLLALHGWLDNAASFVRLAPMLADRRRVIALDLPGHGHSAHLPAGVLRYHMVDQVEHVLAAADALGLDHFDLLGHSLGAGIAALLAAAAPERVDRLLLIDGLGPLADDGSRTLARWRDAHAGRDLRGRPLRVFAKLDNAVAARASVGDLAPEEVRPIVARNVRSVDGGFTWRTDPRLRRVTPVRIDEIQVHRLLAAIVAPTRLLLADPAPAYLPAPMMQARAACLENIEVSRVAGPHHLHVREAETVADMLARFIHQE